MPVFFLVKATCDNHQLQNLLVCMSLKEVEKYEVTFPFSTSLMAVASTTQRSFFKDVQHLYKTIDSSTDGQAAVEFVDDMSVRISLCPKSGCNAHATFYMTITCSSAYPLKPPEVSFDTPIFHSNIDFISGSICLSILTQWLSCYSLLDLVKAILYLIDHPNFESPISDFYEVSGQEEIATKSALLLAGLPVDGKCYAPNTTWCDWARENNCLPTADDVKEGYVWTSPQQDVHECLDVQEEKKSDVSDGNNEALSEMWSDVSSDTIPSFAKIRYSIADEEDSSLDSTTQSKYYQPSTPFEHGMHRIVLFQPTHKDYPEQKSTFYYGEVLCGQRHMEELGSKYLDIFKGSLTFDMQVNGETRQRSRICLWGPYMEDTFSYTGTYSPSEFNYYLTELFRDPKPPRNLTADFCPWSKEDGQGANYLLDRLFFNEERRGGGSFACFLDEDSEGKGSSSNALVELFNTENLDDWEYEETRCVEDSIEESIEEQTEIGSVAQFSKKEEPEDAPVSSLDEQSYEPRYLCWTSMRLCQHCIVNSGLMLEYINQNMPRDWKWVLLQTRWPIRFAPQQSVELSTADIHLPPWRASAGRLLHDVCHYCTKNPNLVNLVLLDPMSLSPLSPLQNVMQRNASNSGQMNGVLLMSTLQALSPFFHVPVSTENCPSPSTLRYLTLSAFATNWVSWISRVEVYSSLGFSRPLSKYVTDSVAAHILQPFSLGCGETPLIDLYPFWLLRNILRASLHLPTFLSCLFHSCTSGGNGSTPSTHAFFPFSDVDEI
nr:ubiquitin conjugating enzyme E2 [Hymenolepis microstoma]